MSELLDSQLAAGDLIAKFIVNTRKLSKDNATIEILQIRLHLLETYWSAYVERHQTLFGDREALKTTNYFCKDLFSDTEAMYIQTKTEIMEALSKQLVEYQQLANSTAFAVAELPQRVTSMTHSLPKLKLPKFSGRQED